MTGTYLTTDGGQNYELVNFPNGASSFAYDPNDPAVIYIGATDLNKTTDYGKTFSRLFPKDDQILSETFEGDHANYALETVPNSIYRDVGDEKRINQVLVDPLNSKWIYFGVNNYFFTSVDSGASWQKIALDNPVEYIYTNKEDLADRVYIFSSDGLTVFEKETRAVSQSSFPPDMKPAFSFSAGVSEKSQSAILYALHSDASLRANGGIASTSLWSSKDLGKTWIICQDSILMNKNQSLPTYSKLATSEHNAEHVYIVASSYQEKKEDGSTKHWYGALKSTDAGLSWNWVWKGGGGSGKYGVRDGADALNQQDAWVQEAFGGEYIRFIDIGVSPNDPNVALLTDWYRVLKTTDGGNSWKEAYSDLQPGGGFRSRGLDVTTSYGVHFDPFDKNHIAISYTDIGFHHSFDGGKSWLRSIEGIPPSWVNTCYWMTFDPEIKNKIWSVWSNLHDFPRGKMTRDPSWKERGRGGVAMSMDGGKTWKPSSEGIGQNTPSTSIVLDGNSPANNRTLYVASYGKGVFKSLDEGHTWSEKNKGIEGSLAAFEITISPDGVLYLVTSPVPQHTNQTKGKEVFFGKLYRSIDGAESWQALDVGNNVLFPSGVAIDPKNPKKIYLAAWADISLADLVGRSTLEIGENRMFDLDGGIFMSEDGGDHWKSIFDKNEYVYDVTVDEFHPGRLYCNTFSRGAFRSDDEGRTWKELKDYDFHWGHRVIVDQNDPEKVFLTTYGSSVWHGFPETK